MGELADRYAQAFLEAGGDGAELARCARQLEVSLFCGRPSAAPL